MYISWTAPRLALQVSTPTAPKPNQHFQGLQPNKHPAHLLQSFVRVRSGNRLDICNAGAVGSFDSKLSHAGWFYLHFPEGLSNVVSQEKLDPRCQYSFVISISGDLKKSYICKLLNCRNSIAPSSNKDLKWACWTGGFP